MSTQKYRAKISLDNKAIKAKSYNRPAGAEGFNFDCGALAFGTSEDWASSKVRRNKKQAEPLF